MQIDWDRLHGCITFVVGTDKNVGKTTFLNYALGALRHRRWRLGCLSTGYDGEQADHLSGRPKPVVRVEAGEHLVTTESALEQTDASLEILNVFGKRTVLGRPLLARVRRAGRAELIGPGDNAGLSEALCRLRAVCTSGTILVDGAINRITQVDAARQVPRTGYITVMRVTPQNLKGAVETVLRAQFLNTLPELGGPPASQDVFEMRGALTQNKLASIPDSCRTLVVDDFSKVFLDYRQLLALGCSRQLRLRRVYNLLFTVVDLRDVGEAEFLGALGAQQGAPPVILNPYLAELACA